MTFEDIKKRADYYDLPIVATYETFSSTHKDKFRVLFLNDVSVTDRPVAEAMQYALYQIFPEADKSCINDVSKMYFGGKSNLCLFYNEEIPQINIDTLFRSLTYHIKKSKGDKHYKEHIRNLANKTGVALNKNGLLDVLLTDEPCKQDRLTEESTGANDNIDIKNGENSPRTIIYNKITNGEVSPFSYVIKLSQSEITRESYVSRDKEGVPAANHKQYRANVLKDFNKCRLYNDFISGDKKLTHQELFHILNNLINVETGSDNFISVINEHTELYGDKAARWKEHTDYNRRNNYKPSNCDTFCPYSNSCNHTKNILTTVHKSNAVMEKTGNCTNTYYPLSEVEEDLMKALYTAFTSPDEKIHVIKAQTAVGKSTSFLKIIKENPYSSILVSLATFRYLKHT